MGAALEDILNSHRTGRAIVMGILNVTPDSFSDGGEFFDTERAVAQGRTMVAEGADIVDVGAESTRPGSDRVSGDEQIDRLREVLPRVVDLGVPVSIDTTRSEVAAFALDAGAAIINDVSAGRDDPEMLPLAGSREAPVVLMHMLGAPKTMQLDPHYEDVVAEVREFLSERLTAAASAGVPETRCIVDPGIGFGKRLEHNLALLNGVGELLELGRPVLIGASRKRFIGELTGQPGPAHRLGGTIAASLVAWSCGATIFRVHEVGPMVAALKVAAALSPPPHRRSSQ
jgi:dihydropteroate synthase